MTNALDVAVAAFADGSTAVVSQDDAELAGYRWRRDVYGYVVRSQGKQNIYLSREVIARQHLPLGRVRFHDGNPLNCTRENVYVVVNKRDGAIHEYSRAGIPRATHTRQPSRFHRQRLDPHPLAIEGYAPPESYLLRWHQEPCAFDEQKRCHRGATAEVIGVAVRKTRMTGALWGYQGGRPGPDGWEFTDLTGETYTTKSYDQGCGWTLAGLDLTVRYPSALDQSGMLRTIATLEGS